MKTALKFSTEEMGALHPTTLTIKSNLAMAYHSQGKTSEAEQALAEVLAARRSTLGSQHPETLYAMSLLGHYDVCDSKLEMAEPLLVETARRMRMRRLDLQSRNHRPRSGKPGGHGHSRKGDLKKLGPALMESHQITRMRHGPDHGTTLGACLAAGLFFVAQGDPAGAEPYLRERLAHFPREPADNPERRMVQYWLGQCLIALAKYADAEPLLISAYEGLKPRERGKPPRNQAELKVVIDQINRLYTAWGKKDEAQKWSTRFDDLVFPERTFASP